MIDTETASENVVIRRLKQTPLAIVPTDADALPVRVHRGLEIRVTSRLSLGVEPIIQLTWTILPQYRDRGYTLMVFRSTTGFCPERYPRDLNRHGQLIIESKHDDVIDERLAECTYYYTFLFHKVGFFGLRESMGIVRFSETIPTARVAKQRITDQIELRELMERQHLGQIEHEAKLKEAELRAIRARLALERVTNPPPPNPPSPKPPYTDPLIAGEIASIDAIVDTFIAKREKQESLEKDPRFRRLTLEEQKAVIDQINLRLDTSEVVARREVMGR